jgi:hypothetical protein
MGFLRCCYVAYLWRTFPHPSPVSEALFNFRLSPRIKFIYPADGLYALKHRVMGTDYEPQAKN